MASAKSVKNQKNKPAVSLPNCCHDCGKEIKIEEKELKNGVLLQYKTGEEEIEILKCNDCFKKNSSLTNYQSCEVYSRIVGYLRPVQQWNVGKQEEFKNRKDFNLKKECC